MDTTLKKTHRKTIDIPEDIFRLLSIKAVAMGTNLKNYIETILVKETEEIKDTELYKYLCANDTEGQKPINNAEKQKFEDWLKV